MEKLSLSLKNIYIFLTDEHIGSIERLKNLTKFTELIGGRAGLQT